jgi:two-component system cell cycle sensor histidine kinase/response regulator CckA
MIKHHRERRVDPKLAPNKYEFRTIDKNGSIKDLIVTIAIIPGTKKSIVSLMDITERKRAEEQIQEQAALLDKAQDAILVRNLEDCITYWNKSAERLYGWTAEEAIGKNTSEILYKDKEDLLRHIEARKSVVERGEWSGELYHITKDGSEITVESRWTLMHDNKGKPKSILIVNTDITGKKKLE